MNVPEEDAIGALLQQLPRLIEARMPNDPTPRFSIFQCRQTVRKHPRPRRLRAATARPLLEMRATRQLYD
ncbi:hypothetical protein [Burkholderia humptydooensis]|uniref:hypothetical protein n=1 Tax=Burkholderia humptydooensis TaxID=430531 RepID=UPI0018E0A9C1|nr:hypothetical protein [Burkholderia humptydooensis]